MLCLGLCHCTVIHALTAFSKTMALCAVNSSGYYRKCSFSCSLFRHLRWNVMLPILLSGNCIACTQPIVYGSVCENYVFAHVPRPHTWFDDSTRWNSVIPRNFFLNLKQWFQNYAPRHTAAPPDVIRCAAKNIEIKINEVKICCTLVIKTQVH